MDDFRIEDYIHEEFIEYDSIMEESIEEKPPKHDLENPRIPIEVLAQILCSLDSIRTVHHLI